MHESSSPIIEVGCITAWAGADNSTYLRRPAFAIDGDGETSLWRQHAIGWVRSVHEELDRLLPYIWGRFILSFALLSPGFLLRFLLHGGQRKSVDWLFVLFVS